MNFKLILLTLGLFFLKNGCNSASLNVDSQSSQNALDFIRNKIDGKVKF